MKNKSKSILTVMVFLLMTAFTSNAQSQNKDCGTLPEGLREIPQEQAQQLWDNYVRSQALPCQKGTWTDKPVLTYLTCLSNPGLYSGLAKNDKGCLFVVWAVEERSGENVSFRYFALQGDLDCSDSGRIGSGICPTRCP